jgi:UDPglucose 6-dehydrogenase
MQVVVIGTGYVGLVSGTCFAEIGHQVTCIDIDQSKVESLKQGKSPIYEPGLEELLLRNMRAKRLNFSSQYQAVESAQVVFLAVGTPSSATGEADLTYLEQAAQQVAPLLAPDSVVVIKSTVPVGTSKRIRELIQQKSKNNFYLVNNPEFLKEGSAIEDFMKPDRVIIGHREEAAAQVMDELYAPLLVQGNPLFKMSNLSAEMSKYAANCMLATKISFINQIAQLCDRTGADIEEVRKGIMSDRRIGPHFLYPGPGYGGSCFPKDVKALIHTAKEYDVPLELVEATEEVNRRQKSYIFTKINAYFKQDLKGRTFAFWGAAFKANTDDIREAPATYVAKALVAAGAKVNFFDPEAADNFTAWGESSDETKGKIKAFSNKYDALNGCDGLVVMTEWREFRVPDFHEIKDRLNSAAIFDARNLYPTSKVIESGLDYFAIGKFIPSNQES